MKIKKIGMQGYGQFDQNQLSLKLDTGLNVMMGSNEAGKSTIRHAIRDLVFGFQMKKLEKHPYKSQLDHPIRLSGEVSFGEHEVIGIQRIFSKKLEGHQVYNGHLLEIGNNPMNEIKNIPLMLYKGLFEMDLSDLVKLDDMKWSAVEDQISVQYGLKDILSPQLFLSHLEKEMHLLWRPNNRGKYEVKGIDEKLVGLKKQQSIIMRSRSQFADKLIMKHQHEKEIIQIEKEIQETLSWQARIETQIPIHRKFGELQEVIKSLEKYDHIEIALEEYVKLQSEIENLQLEKSQIEEDIEKIKLKKQVFNKSEININNNLNEVISLKEIIELHQNYELQYEDAKRHLKQMSLNLEEKSLELSPDPWNDALMSYWKNLSINDLEKNINRLTIMHPKSVLPNVIILIGILITIYGYLMTENRFMLIGGGLVLIDGIIMVLSGLKKIFEFNEIRFQKGIWLKKNIFLNACENMRNKVDEYIMYREEVNKKRGVYEENRDKLLNLIMRFGKQTSNNLKVDALDILNQADVLNLKNRDNRELDLEIKVLNNRKRKIGHTLLNNQQKVNSIKTTVNSKQEKQMSQATEILDLLESLTVLNSRKLKLESEINTMEQELSGLEEYKEVEDLDARLKASHKKINELKERKEDIRVLLTALKKDKERIYEDEKLDAIETEIDRLKSARVDIVNQFNQLKMIHTLISYADKTFKEKYQPDILKRASQLLNLFTDGRYIELFIDEDRKMQLKDSKKVEFNPIHEQMSRGTLEQIYMSMRIAVAETIDKDDHKMPLVLDEVFVNWDHRRMEGALKVLRSLSEDRQIIYMTCHEWMANKLHEEFNAHKIELDNL